mmetsp:Transcript_33043/g.47761  ORF Transcript_33043/g.47761 Transcript_33043/m.47761 type:complete len:299 (+) Transcript_33043:2824-3720(+)
MHSSFFRRVVSQRSIQFVGLEADGLHDLAVPLLRHLVIQQVRELRLDSLARLWIELGHDARGHDFGDSLRTHIQHGLLVCGGRGRSRAAVAASGAVLVGPHTLRLCMGSKKTGVGFFVGLHSLPNHLPEIVFGCHRIAGSGEGVDDAVVGLHCGRQLAALHGVHGVENHVIVAIHPMRGGGTGPEQSMESVPRGFDAQTLHFVQIEEGPLHLTLQCAVPHHHREGLTAQLQSGHEVHPLPEVVGLVESRCLHKSIQNVCKHGASRLDAGFGKSIHHLQSGIRGSGAGSALYLGLPHGS